MSLIDKDRLDSVCQMKPKLIGAGMQVLRKKNRVAYFQDNGSKLLAVAHLDTVNPSGIKWSGQVKLDKTLFFSPYLDDRLGVYTILHVLPALGINVDILFTMDEESGSSTADLFDVDFQYNWIVEFDRKGEDVVCYSFKDIELTKKLESVGFEEGWGTMSDISKMQDRGCKAFNVGIGYENEHGARPWFVIETYERQIERFVEFHKNFKEEHMPHVKTVSQVWSYGQNVGGFNYNQGNFNYERGGSNVSSEYDKWSTERDARERRKKLGAPPAPESCPGWCPVCYRVVRNGSCPECGELSVQEGEWWPKVLSEDAKAQMEMNESIRRTGTYPTE